MKTKKVKRLDVAAIIIENTGDYELKQISYSFVGDEIRVWSNTNSGCFHNVGIIHLFEFSGISTYFRYNSNDNRIELIIF